MAKDTVTIEVVTELVDKGLKQAEKILLSQRKLARKIHEEKRKFINKEIQDEEKRSARLKRLQDKRLIQVQKFFKRKIDLKRREKNLERQIQNRQDSENKKSFNEELQRIDGQIKRRRKALKLFLKLKQNDIKRSLQIQAFFHKRRIKDEDEAIKKAKEVAKEKIRQAKKAARAQRQSIRDLQSSTKNLGRIFFTLFDAIASGARTALNIFSNGMKKVFETGKEFEQTIVNVGAVANLTVEETKKLEKTARQLGATTAFTATEVAAGMVDLARAGLDTNKIVGAIAPTLFLAGAAGSDLSLATKLMARTLAQFNLAGSDAARVADTFTLATQKSLLSIESLDSSMRYAGAAGAFGMSIEETTAAVALFMDQTGLGSTAGTQFRHVIQSLAGPTREAQKVIDQIAKAQGVSSEVMRKRLNPATSTFRDILINLKPVLSDHDKILKLVNKRSAGSLLKILKDFHNERSKFDALTELFASRAGAAQQTYARQMDNVSGETKIVQSKIQESFLQIFDSLKSPLMDVLSFLGEALDEVILNFRAMGLTVRTQLMQTFGFITDEFGGTQNAAQELGQLISRIVIKVILGTAKFIRMIITLRPLIKVILKTILAIFAALTLTAVVAAITGIVVGVKALIAALAGLRTVILGVTISANGLLAVFTILIGLAAAFSDSLFDMGESALGVGRVGDTLKIQTELLRKAEEAAKLYNDRLLQLGGFTGVLGLQEGAQKLLSDELISENKAVVESIRKGFFISPDQLKRQLGTGEILEITDKIIPDAVRKMVTSIDSSLNLIPTDTVLELSKLIGESSKKEFESNLKKEIQRKTALEQNKVAMEFLIRNIDLLAKAKHVQDDSDKNRQKNAKLNIALFTQITSLLKDQVRLQRDIAIGDSFGGPEAAIRNIITELEKVNRETGKFDTLLQIFTRQDAGQFANIFGPAIEGISTLEETSEDLITTLNRRLEKADLRLLDKREVKAFKDIFNDMTNVNVYNLHQEIKRIKKLNIVPDSVYQFEHSLENTNQIINSLIDNVKDLSGLTLDPEATRSLGIIQTRLIEAINEGNKFDFDRIKDPLIKDFNNSVMGFVSSITDAQSDIKKTFTNVLLKSVGKDLDVPPLQAGERNKELESLFERLQKMEEKSINTLSSLRSKETNKFKIQLDKRLDSLKSFYNDGIKLLRNNSKKRLEFIRRFAVLESREREIAFQKAKNDLEKSNKELQDKNESHGQNELQKLKQKHKEEIEALSDRALGVARLQLGALKELESMNKAANDLSTFNLKVGELNFSGIIENLFEASKQLTKYNSEIKTLQQLENAYGENENTEQKINDLNIERNRTIGLINQEIDVLRKYSQVLRDPNLTQQVDGFSFKVSKKQRQELVSGLIELENLLVAFNDENLQKVKNNELEIASFLLGQSDFLTQTRIRHSKEVSDYVESVYGPKIKSLEEDIEKSRGVTASQELRKRIQNDLLELSNAGIESNNLLQSILSTGNNLIIAETKSFANELKLINEDLTYEEKQNIKASLDARQKAASLREKLSKLESQGIENRNVESLRLRIEELDSVSNYYDSLFDLQKEHENQMKNLKGFAGLILGDDEDFEVEMLEEKIESLFNKGVTLSEQLEQLANTKETKDRRTELKNQLTEITSQFQILTTLLPVVNQLFERQRLEISELPKPIQKSNTLLKEFLNNVKDTNSLVGSLFKMLGDRIVALEGVATAISVISAAFGDLKVVVDIIGMAVDKIKSGLDFITGGNLKLNPFDLMSEAANDLLQKQEEFIKKQKEIQDEFRAGRITSVERQESLNILEQERANADTVAKELIDNMIDESIRFIDALIEVAPIIIKRLIEKLPELTRAIQDAIPKILTIIDTLFPVFVPVLTKLFTLAAQVFAKVFLGIIKSSLTDEGSGAGGALGSGIGAGIGAAIGTFLIPGIGTGAGATLGALLGGLGGAVFGDTPMPIKMMKSYNDTPSPIRVRKQEGLVARFAHGDTVIAAKKPQELLRQSLQAVGAGVKMATTKPPPQVNSTRTVSGTQNIDIAVIAEGRVLDAVQMQAMDRGHAPKIAKRLRKASGVKVGFNRGRYNKFAVNEN